MTQIIPNLAWQETPGYQAPIAVYVANLATDAQWIYQCQGFYHQGSIRPNFVSIDNLANQQQVSVSFGPIVYTVNQYSRQTFAVPDYVQTIVVQSIAGANLAVGVIFAISDLSKGDTTNLFAVQNAARGGVLFPIVPKAGSYAAVAADNQNIFLFTLAVTATFTLPDTTAPNVGNGYNVAVWNSNASGAAALVSVATTAGQTINGYASGVIQLLPGRHAEFISDGTNWRVTYDDSPVYSQQTANFLTDIFVHDGAHIDMFGAVAASWVLPAQTINHAGRRATIRGASAPFYRISATGPDTIISHNTPFAALDSNQGDIGEIIGTNAAGFWIYRGMRHFTSAQQTITIAGALTLPHALAVIPDLYRIQLANVIADLNWAPGDFVEFTPAGLGALWLDATNINFRFTAGAVQIFNKTTGAAAAITVANWRLVFTVWVIN